MIVLPFFCTSGPCDFPSRTNFVKKGELGAGVPRRPERSGPAGLQEVAIRGIPMSDKSQNVQDVFLNHVRKNKTPVTVFLVNGVKLQGIITWFDNFCVLLRRDAHSQLVYKHAISTVMPAQPVQLFEPPKEDGEV
jgi:host factor-I protein